MVIEGCSHLIPTPQGKSEERGFVLWVLVRGEKSWKGAVSLMGQSHSQAWNRHLQSHVSQRQTDSSSAGPQVHYWKGIEEHEGCGSAGPSSSDHFGLRERLSRTRHQRALKVGQAAFEGVAKEIQREILQGKQYQSPLLTDELHRQYCCPSGLD